MAFFNLLRRWESPCCFEKSGVLRDAPLLSEFNDFKKLDTSNMRSLITANNCFSYSHLETIPQFLKQLEHLIDPVINTFYFRVLVPLLILYCGLKHLYRSLHVSECYLRQIEKLIGKGKISCNGIFMKHLPLFLYNPLPIMRRVVFSNPTEKVSLKLVDRRLFSSDTRTFFFDIPWDNADLGVPVGHYCLISAMIDGEEVSRAYTPLNLNVHHTLEFGIKICETVLYSPWLVSFSTKSEAIFNFFAVWFPDAVLIFRSGKMSQYLERLPIGTMVDISGPIGSFTYTGNQLFNVNFPRNSETFVKYANIVTMIVAGDSIFRVHAMLNYFAKEGKESPCVKLIYANLTEEDIKGRDFLQNLEESSDFFTKVHVIEEPTVFTPAVHGTICKELLQREMPCHSDNPLIFVFGPSDFVYSVSRDLIELEYPYCRIINW